ncbi:MAG: hypothetical protein ABIE70_13725 [bacterium]
MRGLLADTLAEALERKIVWVFLILTVLGVLMILGARVTDISIQGENLDFSDMEGMFANPVLRVLNFFNHVLVFFAVLATAGLVPSMFIKGRADYYLSKPISRSRLLVSRVAAIWVVYGAMMVLAVLALVVTVWLAFGHMELGVVSVLGIHLLAFLIWLSITTLAGIVGGSNSLSLITVFVVWLAQKLLSLHEYVEGLVNSEFVVNTVKVFYYILPKSDDIYDMVVPVASGGIVSWMPLYTSLLFAVVALAAAALVFRGKDY